MTFNDNKALLFYLKTLHKSEDNAQNGIQCTHLCMKTLGRAPNELEDDGVGDLLLDLDSVNSP